MAETANHPQESRTEPARGVEIRLNGAFRDFPEGLTVSGLLDLLGFAGIPVLVEHNGVALFPRDFSDTLLNAADNVEIIRIVAGG